MVFFKWVSRVLLYLSLPVLLVLFLSNVFHTTLWNSLQYYPDYRMPDESTLSTEAEYGRWFINNTWIAVTLSQTGGYVVTPLNCSGCHKDSGLRYTARPLVWAKRHYPDKEALTNRINRCVTQYHAVKPLAKESPLLRGTIAYLDYLSTGYVKTR